MTGTGKRCAVEPDQCFVVDSFREDDAAGIANLFRAVYGKDYPIKTFYHPERIIRENAGGAVHSVVARTPAGDVVAHGALYRSSPWYDRLYEIGQMLVLPDYRTSFAAFKINDYLGGELLEKIRPAGIFGEAVCHHVITQKCSTLIEMRDVALELDLMPGATYLKETGEGGRVSCLIQFKRCSDVSRLVYIPHWYGEQIRFILHDLGLERELSAGLEPFPPRSKSVIRRKFFSHAGVGRFNVVSSGADFSRRVAELEAMGARRGVQVSQFFVSLGEPWCGAAVEILRSRGYFFGGYVPQWFDTDGILMQKTRTEPDPASIHLYTDKAGEILRMVLADRERATTCADAEK